MSRVKVLGKTGNLEAGNVTIEADERSVVVRANASFSKRQLKYLAKRYLKSIAMRDFMRVVAKAKDSYSVKMLESAAAAEE